MAYLAVVKIVCRFPHEVFFQFRVIIVIIRFKNAVTRSGAKSIVGGERRK